jgi:hypothetical protein
MATKDRFGSFKWFKVYNGNNNTDTKRARGGA